MMAWTVALLVLWCGPSHVGQDRSAVGRVSGQDSVMAVIGPGGGSVQFPGIARVTLPNGALTAPTAVTVSTTDTPSTEAGRINWDVSWGPPSITAAYDVRIRFSAGVPAVPFTVALTVPTDFLDRMPAGDRPTVFVQVVEGRLEELDILRVIESAVYDPASRSVRAGVTPERVRPPEADGTRQVIVLLASVPQA